MTSLASTACLVGIAEAAPEAEKVEPAVEQAHTEIWRRFMDKHHVMLDFADRDGSVSIPMPEECRQGKPNALGWWSPIENGAFFNGLYIEAAVNRWRMTQEPEDAEKARRLADGLMLLASVSDVKGFIARGIATDGKSHYPIGSDDQTLPWFYGLWYYLRSGIAGGVQRQRIIAKIVETADEILRLGWAMPAEAPFGTRGSFAEFLFYQAPRLLFVAKMLHELTAESKWEAIYRKALADRGGKENLSRLALCERGMVYDHGPRHSWTTSNCVAALRGLWEMEKDPNTRAAYARGLEASAGVAMESLPIALQFDNNSASRFEPAWQAMNTSWVPQRTAADAEKVARRQAKDLGRFSPRRGEEFRLVREPAFAAWIVTLAVDRDVLVARAPAVKRVLSHYRYERLYYSQFFPVELAWWRLRLARVA